MLRRILNTLMLVACVIHSSTEQSVETPSRSKMLMKVGGDTSEERLYLERCGQSSLHDSCIFAIDEDINQQAWSNECAVTTADIRPWWDARLENPSYVSKVKIYGLDKVAERGRDALLEFDLIVGEHTCIRYRSYSSFSNKTFACDQFADHIRIQSHLEHSVLALCEVEVYGKAVKVSRAEGGRSVLKTSTCMMSSVDPAKLTARCDLAIDGNVGQAANNGACAITDAERTPWLEVILDNPAIVRWVVLFNRVDCCQDQLNSFEVFVNGQLCFRYDQDDVFGQKEFFCGRFGQRVRVASTKKSAKNTLTLCEIQLFGFPVEFITQSNYKYLGCYREKKRDRDMQKLAGINRMSYEKCERICRRNKKPYFGVQQGKQCWCSERYGMYGKVAEEACWMNCDNSDHQICGSKLRNNVFEIQEFVSDNTVGEV